MEKVDLDQLHRDIKSNHAELVEKLKILGIAEIKILDMIVLMQANNEKPDFIHLTKIFKAGKFCIPLQIIMSEIENL